MTTAMCAVKELPRALQRGRPSSEGEGKIYTRPEGQGSGGRRGRGGDMPCRERSSE